MLSWSDNLGPDDAALNIAGIDTSLGLKNTGGKRERYESLFAEFAERQVGTAEAIRVALWVAGDASTAGREAHSLKGAASTLGVTALAKHAADVEIAITTGQNVDEALVSLSHSLVAVVKAIRMLVSC